VNRNQEVQKSSSVIESDDVASVGHASPRDRWALAASILPGLSLAGAVAVVATVVGRLFPIVGGPVTGIVIGVTLATLITPGPRLRPGIAVASRTILQASVVVLGSQLSLMQIVNVGLGSLPVMLGTLTAALVAAYWIGRWLGVTGNLRTLIGVGTGICGASAIAAITPVIGAVAELVGLPNAGKSTFLAAASAHKQPLKRACGLGDIERAESVGFCGRHTSGS